MDSLLALFQSNMQTKMMRGG
uniref:Uncharacterized protein n=1 Tax=Tetranychus urticae TaxID=32264 RepID=T1K8C8_TETUR